MPGRGKGPLRIAIEDFLETGPLRGFIQKAWLNIWEDIEQEIAARYLGPVRSAVSDADIPGDLKDIFLDATSGQHQGGIIAALSALVGVIIGLVGGAIKPASDRIRYAALRRARSTHLGPGEAYPVMWRAPHLEDPLTEGLRDLGYPDPYINWMKETLRPRLGIVDLLRMSWRFPERTPYYKNELERRGYGADAAQDVELSQKPYPGLQDLVLFSVREVFTPEVVQRFGLDQAFPERFAAETAKIGLDREFAEWYWAAHWQPPSVQLGFEMLHRLRPGTSEHPFTRDDMRLLLQVSDIQPFWHERIMDISYNTPRLTDARAMVEHGVWGPEQLTDFFLDYGYHPDFVPDLVELYYAETNGGAKDLTRASIQKGYEQGLLDRETALDELQRIGYDEFEAQFWITSVEYELAAEKRDEQLKAVEYLYVNREISENDAVDRLAGYGVQGDKISSLLEVWRVKREGNIKLPTKAELVAFYKQEIIDDGEFRSGLVQLGYSPNRVEWLMEQTDLTIQQERLKELTTEREKEQRTNETTSRRSVAAQRAALDVKIAEYRATLADIKVYLHSVEDEAEAAALSLTVDQIKAEIAALQQEKAQLSEQLLNELAGD